MRCLLSCLVFSDGVFDGCFLGHMLIRRDIIWIMKNEK